MSNTTELTANRPEHCYGCAHMTIRRFADSATYFGCRFKGGCVTGSDEGYLDHNPTDPKSCERYETPNQARERETRAAEGGTT